jgi:hypothetical protein
VSGRVSAPGGGPAIDHARIGRRLRRWLTLLVLATLVAWLVGGMLGDGPTLRSLLGLLGVGVLLALFVEIVVVGGAAVSAALSAGAQGDRLASSDVSLVPPQVAASLRKRRGSGAR